MIEEYERLFAGTGAHAGIVDLATFNVVNAVLAAALPARLSGDWLLVNVAPDYVSLAILRGPHLIFFRNRAAETDGTLADLVHQTAMYYEDRLSGAGFVRVLLAGASGGGAARHLDDVELVRRSLQERLRDHGRHRRSARGRHADRSHLGGAGVSRHPRAARRHPAARAGAWRPGGRAA